MFDWCVFGPTRLIRDVQFEERKITKVPMQDMDCMLHWKSSYMMPKYKCIESVSFYEWLPFGVERARIGSLKGCSGAPITAYTRRTHRTIQAWSIHFFHRRFFYIDFFF